MNQTITVILFLLALVACTPPAEHKKSDIDYSAIEKEILDKGQAIIWALNEANADTLARDFWQSDSTLFLIDGNKIEGYETIRNLMYDIPNARKSIDVEIRNQQVQILSADIAIHLVEFDQVEVLLNDSINDTPGLYTTVYKRIGGDWKIVQVHESHLKE